MDEKIVEEILNDLYSAFEDADSQSTALMLFIKGQGIATDEKLAPYLDQAGKASDVKWRAARARMSSLLKSIMKSAEPGTNKKHAAAEDQELKNKSRDDSGQAKGNAAPQSESGSQQSSEGSAEHGDRDKETAMKSLSETKQAGSAAGNQNSGNDEGSQKEEPPSMDATLSERDKKAS